MNFQETMAFVEESVMVWGGIDSHVQGCLRHSGALCHAIYPILRGRFCFNARSHTGPVAKNYLWAINVNDGLARCSPDMNPIGHVWDVLRIRRKVRGRISRLANMEG